MVIGLTWLPPIYLSSSNNERRKKRELAKFKNSMTAYVEIDTPAGVQLGISTSSEDLGIDSAAALLAQAHKSLVLIEPLGDNSFWLCTIEDGAIFPAGDLLGDKDIVADRLQEISSDIAGTDIRVYDQSQIFGIEGSLQSGFSDIIGDTAVNIDISCREVQTSSMRTRLVGLSMVAATVGSLAYGGYLFSSNSQSDQQKQISKEQSAQAALEKERNQIKSLLQQNFPALLATFADKVYNRPLRASGWRAYSYVWENNQISVTWKNEYGSLSGIVDFLNKSNVEWTNHSDAVLELIDFPVATRETSWDIDDHFGDETARLTLLDNIYSLPGDWTLKQPKTSGNNYQTTRTQLVGGSDHLNDMIATAYVLKNLPIHISRITLNLTDSFKWKIEGEHIAKNN